MQVFLAVWLFAVGGCVGSFVNVVALRMPAGIGIVRSSSRCPLCLHPIRWYDNVPLIGWLMLRGRCRDCGTWISIRYPLVELLVASVVPHARRWARGWLTAATCRCRIDAPHFYHLPPPQYWSVYGYHSILLVTLFTLALIRFDSDGYLEQVFFPAMLVGLAAAPFFVWLHPVPVCHMVGSSRLVRGDRPTRCGGCWPASPGLLCLAHTGRPTRGRSWEQPELWATTLCGVFLGWQAVVAVVLMAAVGYLAAVTIVTPVPPPRGTGPWCGYLTLAGLLYIIEWGQLVERFPSLGPRGSVGVLCVLALAACGVSLVTGT